MMYLMQALLLLLILVATFGIVYAQAKRRKRRD